MAAFDNSDMTVHVVLFDPAERATCVSTLQQMGFRSVGFDSIGSLLNSAQGPSVLVYGLPYPEVSTLIQELLSRGLYMPIVVVAASPSVRFTVDAMKGGAVSVLPSPVEPDDLWEATRDAIAAYRTGFRNHWKKLDARTRIQKLTSDEQDVLRLLMEGKPTKIIASRLGVSMRTIEARKRRIVGKTRVGSFAELILQAVAADLPGLSYPEFSRLNGPSQAESLIG